MSSLFRRHVALSMLLLSVVACGGDDDSGGASPSASGGSAGMASAGSAGAAGTTSGGSAGSTSAGGAGSTSGGSAGTTSGGSAGTTSGGAGGAAPCPGKELACSPPQVAWVTNANGYGVALFFGQVSCYVSGATLGTTTGVYFQRSPTDALTVTAPESYTFASASTGTVSGDGLTVTGLGLDGAMSFVLVDAKGNKASFSAKVDLLGVEVSKLTFTAACMM